MSIASCLLSFVLVVPSFAQAPVVVKAGSYLKATYIQELKQTRSPYKSIGKGGVLEFDVSVASGKTTLLPIVDFHDSGITYILHNNSLAVRSDNQYPEDNFQVEPRSANTFFVSTPGSYQGVFEFVGSVDEFLRAETITGNYVDSKGRSYLFGKDGMAVFPDHQFTYQIGCDHFDAPFDYIFGADLFWAFSLNGDTLKFFKCNQDGPTKREAKPFLILKRAPK